MNAMNAMTKKQKTETSQPGDAAHYEELEELQLESVAAGDDKAKRRRKPKKISTERLLRGS